MLALLSFTLWPCHVLAHVMTSCPSSQEIVKALNTEVVGNRWKKKKRLHSLALTRTIWLEVALVVIRDSGSNHPAWTFLSHRIPYCVSFTATYSFPLIKMSPILYCNLFLSLILKTIIPICYQAVSDISGSIKSSMSRKLGY